MQIPAKFIRRFLKTIAVIIAILIALVAIAGFTLQTDWGRDRLVLLLNSRLKSSGETNIAIGRVDGNLLKSFSIDQITVADSRGVWLDLRNTTVAWNAWALYWGIVDITSIEGSALTITRKPIAKAEPKSDTEMPDLSLLKRIRLEHFALPQIKLDHSVMGQSVLLSAHWNLTKNLDGLRKINLQIKESKHDNLQLILNALYQPQSGRVSLDLNFHDPANGLITNLLDLEHPSDFFVQASGRGFSNDWSGTISAKNDSRQIADLAVSAEYIDEWTARLFGKIDPLSLFGTPSNTGLMSPVLIDTELAYQNNQLEIVNSAVENSLADIQISGTISTEQLNLDAHLALKPQGIDELERHVQPLSMNQSTMTAKLAGSVNQPEVLVDLTLFGPRTDKINAEKLSATTKIQFDPHDSRPFARANIESTGEITKVQFKPNRQDSNHSEPASIESLNWSMNASYNQDDASIELQEALFSAPFGRLQGSGQISLNDQPGDIQIKAEIGQLSALSTLLEQPISGSATLKSHLTMHNGTETISATVNGETDRLSLNNATLDPLLGPKLTIKAELHKAFDRIEINRVQITAATTSATGNFELALDNDAITGDFRFSAPHLTPYSALLGTPIAGSLLVNGAIGGYLEQATISGLVTVSRLRLNQIDLGLLKAKLTSEGIPRQTSGSVRFDFDGGDLAGTNGSTHFDLGQDETMKLDPILIKSLGAVVNGKLVVPTNNLPIHGTVTANIPSLANWSEWLGLEVSGSTTAKIDLSAKNQSQLAQFDLDASEFSISESIAARHITLRGQINDLLVKPSGNAFLTANGAQIIGAQISELSAQAKSEKPSEMLFNVAAQGNLNGPLSLNVAGKLSQNAKRLSVDLSQFSGLLVEQKIMLRNNLKFTKSGDQFQLNDLSLAIGDGSISGHAIVSEKELNASLAINNLALTISRLAGSQSELNGSLSGTARIFGPRRSPQAQLELQAEHINLTKPRLAIGQNHWVKIHGNLQNKQLNLNADIGGLGDHNAEIGLTLPVQTTTDASLFRIAPQQPITGGVSWRGEIAPIWTLISDNEDRFEGHGELAVSLAGTIEQPSLNGHFYLTKADYANIETGTALSDIVLRVNADNHRLIINELSANDGSNGKLHGSGNLALQPDSGYPVKLELNFENTLLIATDELSVNAGGQLGLAGDLDRPLLLGNIVTQNIELNLEQSERAQIVKLQVEEINNPKNQVAERRTRTAQIDNAGAQLDLTISIPGKAFVRGLGLESEWRGSLSVTGDADAPNIRGVLEPVRGFFSVWGRNFDLKRSAIRFSGERDLDPLLNLTAEYKSTGITAIVRVSGTASKPKIDLSSRPPMPQSEIASRVLFGTDSKSLSPAQSIQLASAVSNLSGLGGTGNFIDATRRMLGIDVLKFGESDINSDKTRISMGKYVADGVYVELQQGTDSASHTSATVEFEILPNISVEGGTTERGGNKVGLKWRWDY